MGPAKFYDTSVLKYYIVVIRKKCQHLYMIFSANRKLTGFGVTVDGVEKQAGILFST